MFCLSIFCSIWSLFLCSCLHQEVRTGPEDFFAYRFYKNYNRSWVVRTGLDFLFQRHSIGSQGVHIRHWDMAAHWKVICRCCLQTVWGLEVTAYLIGSFLGSGWVRWRWYCLTKQMSNRVVQPQSCEIRAGVNILTSKAHKCMPLGAMHVDSKQPCLEKEPIDRVRCDLETTKIHVWHDVEQSPNAEIFLFLNLGNQLVKVRVMVILVTQNSRMFL